MCIVLPNKEMATGSISVSLLPDHPQKRRSKLAFERFGYRAPAAVLGGGTWTTPMAAAWDVIFGQSQRCNDLADGLTEVQECLQLSAGATL